MDLSQLKQQSDLSYDRAVAKQTALARAESQMLLVYEKHIYRADSETICLVRTLKEHRASFYLLDANRNPALIDDPDHFLQKLVEKNQEALNSYHQIHQSLQQRGD